MKTTTKQRMALSKETIRGLSAGHLKEVVGGGSGIYTCAFTCVQYTGACTGGCQTTNCGITAGCGSLMSYTSCRPGCYTDGCGG